MVDWKKAGPGNHESVWSARHVPGVLVLPAVLPADFFPTRFPTFLRTAIP